MQDEIPVKFTKKMRLWNFYADLWFCVGYFFVVAGILLNSVVAVFADEFTMFALRLLSFLGVTFTTMFVYLKPLEAAKKFNEASCVLNIAILSYDNLEHNCAKLVEAYKEGERIIARIPMPKTPSQATG